MRTLIDICEDYIDSISKEESTFQADWKRTELHQELFVFLDVESACSKELGLILHSLDFHIGLPFNILMGTYVEKQNKKKYGRLLAELLKKKFEPENDGD